MSARYHKHTSFHASLALERSLFAGEEFPILGLGPFINHVNATLAVFARSTLPRASDNLAVLPFHSQARRLRVYTKPAKNKNADPPSRSLAVQRSRSPVGPVWETNPTPV